MNIYEEYIENVIQLAQEAINENRLEEGRRLLESGLMEEPGYARLHAKMGDLYCYDLENLELAERHYHLAIRFNPKYQEVYSDLASMYLDHKKYKGLRMLMKKALEVEDIDRAFVYEKLGMASEAEGRYKEAIQYYKKGLFESLDNVDADELKRHIKRNKYKRLKLRWKRVQS